MVDLSIREIENSDIELIADYWLQSDHEHLIGMGVDLDKIPSRESFRDMLSHQISLPISEKATYALIWLIDGNPIGHCNVNKIHFGEEAYMHLHYWDQQYRGKGFGTELLRQCVHHFFEKLQLKRIISEPYAENEAPNRTLTKVGFELKKKYVTTPGSINFEQEVKSLGDI